MSQNNIQDQIEPLKQQDSQQQQQQDVQDTTQNQQESENVVSTSNINTEYNLDNQQQQQQQEIKEVKENKENSEEQVEIKSKLFAKSEWYFHLKKKNAAVQNIPFKRWGHTAVMYQKSMYIFGGNGAHITHQKQQKNWEALYRFDCELNEWEKVFPSTQTEKPFLRDSHAVTRIDDKMYMFGGSDTNEQIFNDFWTFCFTTHQWQKLEQLGDIPAPREGLNLIALNDQYIFLNGGIDMDNEKIYNDYYIYDIQTKIWKNMTPVGDVMPERESQSACLVNDNIYLFGGQQSGGSQRYYNDLYVISVAALLKKNATQFMLRKVQLTTDVKPEPRTSHAICAYKNRFLIIIGGEGSPNNIENEDISSSVKNSPNKKLKKMSQEGEENADKIDEEDDDDKNSEQNKSQQDKKVEDQFFPIDTMYIFDTEMKSWQQLDAPRAKGVGSPFPRFCHSAVVFKNNIIIFGGLLNLEQKSDDTLKLRLQDEGEELEEQNAQSKIIQQNSLTGQSKNTNNICQNCSLVLGISDWVSAKPVEKEQAAMELIESQATQDNNKKKKLQITQEFQKEEEILRKKLAQEYSSYKIELGNPKVSISFVSSVLELMSYPFGGFGLIVDASKLIKTKNLNLNLFIANRKAVQQQTNFNYGTFIKSEITDNILKDHDQKLYFQVFDDTEAFNDDQFKKVVYQLGDLHQNVDIQMDEDDQNFTEDERWDNYSSLMKLGCLRLGDTAMIVSKDKKGILRVGYISTMPQNNPNVNDMICFMFIYDSNEQSGEVKFTSIDQKERFLSENGKLHKDLITNNIRDYMSQEQLLLNHDQGNYFYIFNLKRIPKQGNMLDYEFQYNSQLHDLYINKSGYQKFQRKEIVQNLVDFSFKQYLTLLYIDQKPHQELSIFFNQKPIEMKNYKIILEKLQKDGQLKQAEIPKSLAQIKDCGQSYLYTPTEYISQEIEKQKEAKKEETVQENIVKEEEQGDVEQKQQENQENNEIKEEEEQNKQEEKNKENNEEDKEDKDMEIEEVKQVNQQQQQSIAKTSTDEDEVEVEVLDETEDEKNKKGQVVVLSDLEIQQQGILLYYKKRLIGRGETKDFGEYFVHKIMRKSIKTANKNKPYLLRYSGVIELQEFLKPSIFQFGIKNQFFSTIMYSAFKSLIRLTKQYDRQKIQEQLIIQLEKAHQEKKQKEENMGSLEEVKALKENLEKKEGELTNLNEKYQELENLKKKETENSENKIQEQEKILEEFKLKEENYLNKIKELEVNIQKYQLQQQQGEQNNISQQQDQQQQSQQQSQENDKESDKQQQQEEQQQENPKKQQYTTQDQIIDLESDNEQQVDETKQSLEAVQQNNVKQNDEKLEKYSQQMQNIQINCDSNDDDDDKSKKLKEEQKQRQQQQINKEESEENQDNEGSEPSKKVKTD